LLSLLLASPCLFLLASFCLFSCAQGRLMLKTALGKLSSALIERLNEVPRAELLALRVTLLRCENRFAGTRPVP
jgi:hypothetical protein